ncbi:MAG: gamma-glutamyl-gamma-aminobutyrate hydrolase family protein [Pseudomonadota bacterium]
MAHILILEGNPPNLLAHRRRTGLAGMAECYADALAFWDGTLAFTMLRPYFPDHRFDPGVLETVDGVVCTGSGVEWSAADGRAAPFWTIFEAAFRQQKPVLGSCWGLQIGTVVLGGGVRAAPQGVETPVARAVRLTPEGANHALHAGRPAEFGALCVHRDEVHAVPFGSVITAENAHSAVQGMVHEPHDTRFWGVQYHPEMQVRDMALILDRQVPGGSEAVAEQAADMHRLAEAPEDPLAAERQQIGPDITDRHRHAIELRNWLSHGLGALAVSEAAAE